MDGVLAGDLLGLLKQIDILTRTLATGIVLSSWAELSREERKEAVARLREAHLRIGNVLEEWNTVRNQPEG